MTVKTAVSAPFKSMRRDQLKKTEVIYFLTIDKRWMNKEQAGRLIKIALNQGLLEESGPYLKPLFPVSEVEIPLGYKPSSDIFEADENPAEVLVENIAEKLGIGPEDVVAEINGIIKKGFDGNISFEAAAVIAARKYKVSFEDKIPILLKESVKGA
ncbi:hypothetical protein J2128_001005 [Methanomicrobium sp. W14]|uniref:DUF2240 family protein n=1 Tax=Methanomicrobium sp. W14 TaxID=2817839 RepID=UPI001AE8B82B|nr:DUF2240 family protein [Methanomicrobium sp. W14]MBP2133084.1 hypothetical protein [Methanomicrobium sp. W14]